MASCALESSTKNRLEDVRVFLFHNLDMLEKYADRDKAAGESRFIALINKREKHLCRSIHRAKSGVQALCYSPDGSKLARAEGRKVVVCDACTGFVQQTLTVDSGVWIWSVAFAPDGSKIAAAYSDEIQIFDAQTKSKIGLPLSGHSGYVTAVSYSCLFSNVWCVLTIEHFTA
jgi:WD40 repeat protein